MAVTYDPPATGMELEVPATEPLYLVALPGYALDGVRGEIRVLATELVASGAAGRASCAERARAPDGL